MLQILGETPHLNELNPCNVSLVVPIEHDAIQIGRFEDALEFAQLAVRAEPGLVTVRREDGVALQIESHFDNPPDDPEGTRMVLAEPLGRIVLRRHRLIRSRWGIDDVEITKDNCYDLTTFAELIGEHAKLKQKKR